MVGIHAAIQWRHQDTKGVFPNDALKRSRIGHGKMGGCVHEVWAKSVIGPA
jgi:hypothetical protein